MPKQNVLIAALNRGRISKLGLARDDLQGNRIRYGGQLQTNIIPRVLGSAMLRPGFGYTGYGSRNNLKAVHLPFLFSSLDMAMLEITDLTLRVKIDEVPISRVAVTTTVTNGDFGAAGSWTDIDEGAGDSQITGGKLRLVGTGFAEAARKQDVTVAGANLGKEHALRIVVERGPVTFRCGSTDGADDYIAATTLGTGVHSLAFTPTGHFFIKFSSTRQYAAIVDSCTVEAAGVMELPTPWVEADRRLIRWQQSNDVVYLGCKGYQQRKIERRGSGRSWSVVLYEPEDGPFRVLNTGVTRITPSDTKGDITLTASKSLFRLTSVGALYQMTSLGQHVEAVVSGEDQWSDPIRVIGVGVQRTFSYTIAGSWVGTVKIQRSVEAPGAWVDVNGLSFTANAGPSNYSDGLNNQIIYYRIGVKTGGYTSGSPDVSLDYSSGGITGVVRITAFTSETSVSAVVLKTLGGTDSTSQWREGEWSARRGYPMVPVLDDGRLWWAGKSKLFGSVSDAYEGFDPDTVGDAGPINRSIPAGNVDDINWMLSLERLCAGGPAAEFVIRSSSLDEPLTPTLFGVKAPSERGSAPIPALKLDTSGIFVGKSGTKLFELKLGNNGTAIDYSTDDGDLTQIVPEIGDAGFVRIALQRYPDTRVHGIRGDGTAAVMVIDASESVKCWIEVETDGFIEDLVVMPAIPGETEDKVYYHINRTVNGATVRYLERWAKESECKAFTLSKLADCFVLYQGAATATINNLGHLEGKQVVVWADGKDFSPLDDARAPHTFTVTGGSITLPAAVQNAVVGLWYRGRFKGTKLAYAAGMGTALGQRKKVNQIGIMLADVHNKGIYFGSDFDRMDTLPEVGPDGDVVTADTVFDEYDHDMTEFPGTWSTDSRVCLEMSAPRACTIAGLVLDISTNDKG